MQQLVLQHIKLNSWLEADTPPLLYFNNRIKYSAVIQFSLAQVPCSSDPMRKAENLSVFLVITLMPITTTWLETKFRRGVPARGAVTPRAFTSVVSFLKEVLWEKFLSASCLLLCQASPFCWPFRDGPMRSNAASSAALLLWQRKDNGQQAN